MRYTEIDIIKGVCIFLVFFQHSILVFPINLYAEYPVCKWMTDVICSYYMPCFFVVSGFLYAKSSKNWKMTILDKVKRILIPYLTVCMIQFSVKLLVPQLAFGSFNTLGEYAEYYFLRGGDRWFLYVLFLVFLWITPLKRYLNSILCVSVLLSAVYFVVLGGFTHFYPITKTLYYSLFFLWGFILREYYSIIKKILIEYWYCAVGVFLLMNCLFLYDLNQWIRGIFTPLMGTLFMFSATLYSLKISNIHIEKLCKIFTIVGKYSLQFYVMTGFVLPPARIIMVNMLHQTNPWIVIPGVLSIQLLLATIGVMVFMKWKVTRWAFGY